MNEQDVFVQSLRQLDESHRLAFLKQACQGQPELRRRVEVLLNAHDRARGFLESPAAGCVATLDQAPPPERPGTVIGPYKLLQEIGEGGMGVVYMAEQERPVRRRVAVKIIKPGMDSRQVIARFEAERQALAMMDHQNIAKVLDAGTVGEVASGQEPVASDQDVRCAASLATGHRLLATTARPYFVMELVHGVLLTQFCDDKRLSVRQRLELFIPVCHAIQHAHQKGIIHRDIKPSNVLVTMYDDKPVPKVIDFGVAKAVEQRLTDKTLFTHYGTLVGTFEYMSPEQAEMNALGVDTRSDIYSLGVLLYELLTGQTPFDRERLAKSGLDEIRRIIREEEPETVSQRIARTKSSRHTPCAVPGDGRRTQGYGCPLPTTYELDWIVMKSLEKDRTRRYESASSLAADIERYLHDEPVHACPPSTLYRFQKFARKHKPALATAAAIALCLLLGTTVSAWQAVRATTAEAQANANATQAQEKAQEANQQRDVADKRRNEVENVNKQLEATQAELRKTLYAANVNLAQHAWAASNPDRVFELLEPLRPQAGQSDLRGFEWHYLHRLSRSELLTLTGHTRSATSIAYSPDGRRIASAARGVRDPVNRRRVGGEVKMWDAQTGKTLLTIEGDGSGVQFSPDGKRLGVAIDREVKVLDVESFKELLKVDGYGVVAFSSDGKRLATGGDQGEGDNWQPLVKLWDAQTGQPLTSPKNSLQVEHLAFSPDGKLLVGANSFDNVKVWNVQTGDVLHTLPAAAWDLAFSPDGKLLATASRDVKFWDVLTGQAVRTLENQSFIGIAFSPDGNRFVGTGRGSLRVLDTQSGKEIRTLKGRFGYLAFSPDGNRVANVADDNLVRVWDVQKDQESRTLDRLGARGFAISADWSRYFRPAPRNGLSVRNVQSGQEIASLKGHSVPARVVAISPDGKRVASGAAGPDPNSVDSDDQAEVKIWNATTGQELFTLQGSKGAVFSLTFSPDGKRLAAVSQNPPNPSSVALQIWNAENGEEIVAIRGHKGPLTGVVFSPDGNRVASAGGGVGGEVKVWDAHTGKALHAFPIRGAGWRQGLAYSPDGMRLACGGNQKIAVLDAHTGQELVLLKGHTLDTPSLTFSPDGNRLASLGRDGHVKIWNAHTGQELLTLEGRSELVSFSPDGYRLACGGPNGTVRIYDATPLPEKP